VCIFVLPLSLSGFQLRGKIWLRYFVDQADQLQGYFSTSIGRKSTGSMLFPGMPEKPSSKNLL